MAKENYNKQALHRLLGAIVLLVLAVILVPRFIRMPNYQTLADLDITYPGEDRTVEDQAIAAAAPEQPPATTTASTATPIATQKVQEQEPPSVPATAVPQSSVPVAVKAVPKAAPAKPVVSASKPQSHPAVTKPKETKPVTHTGSDAVSKAQDEDQVLALIQGTHTARAGVLVQIAAYSNQADAVSRANRLRSHGIYKAYVETIRVKGRKLYRLRVGPFKTYSAAQSVRAKLKKLGYPSSLVK